MPKHYNLSHSDFYCTNCGKKGMPIARKQGQERTSGHLKKLYCIYCQKEVNHVEIRLVGSYTYETFLQEFNSGIFKDGQRIYN